MITRSILATPCLPILSAEQSAVLSSVLITELTEDGGCGEEQSDRKRGAGAPVRDPERDN